MIAEKEEVIRQERLLYGKPNRAGHFPVIIMAITRHEGLIMDLLILHVLRRQPLCLSGRGSIMMCLFYC